MWKSPAPISTCRNQAAAKQCFHYIASKAISDFRHISTLSLRAARVYAPTHPGYGTSERPEWLETISDLARFYLWMLQKLELDRVHLIGGFVGGWIAAEMAVMCPRALNSLTLIGTAGVRPSEGEIADIFLLGEQGTMDLAIGDPSPITAAIESEERDIRARGREMTTRLCWKPYMHSPSLIHLLPRVEVPTLVVWGELDRIVARKRRRANCGRCVQRSAGDNCRRRTPAAPSRNLRELFLCCSST